MSGAQEHANPAPWRHEPGKVIVVLPAYNEEALIANTKSSDGACGKASKWPSRPNTRKDVAPNMPIGPRSSSGRPNGAEARDGASVVPGEALMMFNRTI